MNNLPKINLHQTLQQIDEETSQDSSNDDSKCSIDEILFDEDNLPPRIMTQQTRSSQTTNVIEFVIEPIIDDNDEEEVLSLEQKNSSKTSSGKFQTVTLDDLPPIKWRIWFQEFKAWTLLKTQKPKIKIKDILLLFVSRFTGFYKTNG